MFVVQLNIFDILVLGSNGLRHHIHGGIDEIGLSYGAA